MRIHKNVRKAIGFVALFMAFGTVMQLIKGLQIYRVYDPEVVADLTWIAITFYGIWWGFRERPDPATVNREIQGEWPKEKQGQ